MISIIIVTYNSSKYINRCIDSILKSDLLYIPVEIIIVDNNSINKVNIVHNNIQIYNLKENRGYSKSLNYGIKKSNFPNILIMNPDTFFENGSIQKLYSYFTSLEKESVVGCKILNFDSSFQLSSRRKFPSIKFLIPYILKLHKFGMKNNYNYNNILNSRTHKVDSVSGAFMLFSRSLYDKLNGFDERFFLYFEDTDFCLRAKGLGCDTIYFSESSIYHKKYGSTTFNNYLFVRFHFYKSFIKFSLKHYNNYFKLV